MEWGDLGDAEPSTVLLADPASRGIGWFGVGIASVFVVTFVVFGRYVLVSDASPGRQFALAALDAFMLWYLWLWLREQWAGLRHGEPRLTLLDGEMTIDHPYVFTRPARVARCEIDRLERIEHIDGAEAFADAVAGRTPRRGTRIVGHVVGLEQRFAPPDAQLHLVTPRCFPEARNTPKLPFEFGGDLRRRPRTDRTSSALVFTFAAASVAWRKLDEWMSTTSPGTAPDPATVGASRPWPLRGSTLVLWGLEALALVAWLACRA